MRSELFKTALQNYKDELAKCLQEGGEGKRVSAFLEKIDHQIPLSQHMFDVAWQHQQSKIDDLQKRVDQQGLIIAKVMSIASDLQKSWEMFEIGKKLEQALKGGSDETN